MNKDRVDRSKKYLNPYLGGVLLGIVLLAANFVSGRGLGASGAIKSVVVTAVDVVAPAHIDKSPFYTDYFESNPKPLKSWLVFHVVGVIVGGFISGVLANRLRFKVEHSPKITSRRRLVFALAGGILFGLGSQIGRGCTSGAALSGMAVLSFGGIVTMMTIFATAYGLAYFFRKNWI